MVAEPVEQLITAGMLHRLDTGELADNLAGRTAQDEALAALATHQAEDQTQLEELAAAYAEKLITMKEWLAARSPIVQRISQAARRLSRASNTEALHGLVGNGAALSASWDGLNLDRQTAIIRAVLDHAVIHPGVPGARRLDPKRVNPFWRL